MFDNILYTRLEYKKEGKYLSHCTKITCDNYFNVNTEISFICQINYLQEKKNSKPPYFYEIMLPVKTSRLFLMERHFFQKRSLRTSLGRFFTRWGNYF